MDRTRSILQKYYIKHRYTLFFLTLVIAAALLRLEMIRHNWPTMNSDEAVMALMAKHMAEGQGIPLVIYGQAYMGSLEAMLGAVFYHLTGPSIFSLRLGLLVIFILFLTSMYFMTCLLYNRQLALITCALLCLGTPEIFLHQLFAAGGYPEIVWLGSLLFLVATLLAISAYCDPAEEQQAKRRRLCLFAAYGLLAGLAIWSDPLVIPVIVASGLLLLRFAWREVRWLGGGLLLIGLLIGLAPLIKHNLDVPWQQSTLVSLLHLQQGTTGDNKPIPSLLLVKQQFSSTLLYALPAISGANPLCPTTSLPFFGPMSLQTLTCSLRQGLWSLGYFILGSIACMMALRAIKRYHQQTRISTAADEERRTYVLQWARLSLLLCALLVLLAYLSSPVSAMYAGPTTRYLVCLDIATPALLWPFWLGWHYTGHRLARVPRQAIRLASLAGFLIMAITLLIGTFATFQQIPGTQRTYQNDQKLTSDLMKIGATRIYTEYWTCNKLILLSNERILCSNVKDQLQPGQDRYLPYRTAVRSTPGAIYVFPANAPQLATLEHKIQQDKIPFKRYTFDHYVVYEIPNPI
jgi:4-amino-4-deoxy-L-arabinose transferase-like glycosyltransferase